MPTDGFERLAVRRDGGRVDVTLDWPERRNALDFTAWEELGRALGEVADDDGVRVVTLTGAGDAFCAGVAFDAIGAALEVERTRFPSFIRRWADVADRLERLAQPTVAVVNGPAIGAGFELLLACDIRIASDRAVFAMPQLRMGIVPDVGGTSRLARAVGPAAANDIVLTSRLVDAREALRLGVVSRVVPHERLAAEADGIAAAVAALPWPSAYFATMAIDSGPRLDPRRAADLEAIVDQVMLRQEEVWERIAAFMAAKGIKGD